MTLTQLSAFVLVARLGSVKDAAKALNVSEPAVSQALTALRQHVGDQLITRDANGMTLTPGGARLLPVASQMVALGAEAQAAVRAAQGLPSQLRLVTTSVIAEFIAGPLTEAFSRRLGRGVEASAGVAASTEMPVLVANRLADLALGPSLADPGLGLVSEPVFRCKMVAVTSPRGATRGGAPSWPWLVDPSGVDPASDVTRLLRRLGVPESRVMVFPNQTAAWAAAADGEGVAPGVAHLVSHQVRRGELRMVETAATPMEATWYATSLSRDLRPSVVGSLRNFLGTPEAMQLMRAPRGGVPPSRFRPPVYVTIWS
ncbi:MAG: LysR family transcriptional regulator [Streptosporangiaceae bacterium]|nr:LysR family transcriptional regulator [Streptosporangiaceae bacterium]